MSRIGASARRYYSDGITRVTDPFWKMKAEARLSTAADIREKCLRSLRLAQN